MTLKKYGVWATQATSYDTQPVKRDSDTAHIFLNFADGGSAAINVKSTSRDKRLVFWVYKNFQHPITQNLASLGQGLQEIPRSKGSDIALDFQRTDPPLLDVNAGQILPSHEDGPNNDILDKLEPILEQAISEKATVYLFGQYYHDSDGESGIHDIHMNQGNGKGYSNATYSDGSFMVQFKDGHWEAVFLAFASQALPTDNRGDPTSDAKPFDQVLTSSS